RIALTSVTRGPFQNAYLGYWVDEGHQGRGIAKEAVDLVLAFVFETLDLHRVQAAVMPRNAPSRHLLSTRGFREEGIARRYLCIAGSWEDHILYGMTREDWQTERSDARRGERNGRLSSESGAERELFP